MGEAILIECFNECPFNAVARHWHQVEVPASQGMLPILHSRPTDASEIAKRWFKSQDSQGGTGKAEDAKLQEAGISPKQNRRYRQRQLVIDGIMHWR